jgi:hypothetical protein
MEARTERVADAGAADHGEEESPSSRLRAERRDAVALLSLWCGKHRLPVGSGRRTDGDHGEHRDADADHET